MKRARAQQPKAPEQQDAAVCNPKQQRRAKQPRQPKGGAKKPAAATGIAAAATVAKAADSPVPETAPDVCFSVQEASTAGALQAMDWDLDAGLSGGGAWWTWGVDEDKLLGWFPFVEEDFRCLAGRAGDAEAAFDDDIWRIHQIYEIPSYAAK
jgi:hypothetical protein